MSFAKGFADNTEGIIGAVKSFLQQSAQQQALDDFVKKVVGLNQRIGNRFKPNTKVQSKNPDNTNKAPETVDVNDAMQQGNQDISEFVISSLGNKNIPEDKLKQALTGLGMNLQSHAPKKMDLQQFDPQKDIYDSNSGKLVREGKTQPDFGKVFDGNSEEGYWKNSLDESGNPKREWIKNPNYVPKKTGNGSGNGSKNDDGLKDPSKLLGTLKQGITKLRGIKTAKLDKKSGYYKVPDPNNLGFYDATQDEMTNLKEQYKGQFVDDAVTLVNQQGLNGAVEDVRAILDKLPGGRTEENLPKALDAFMKINPDYDETDRDILDTWFTLFLQ